jgi:hypothetical protein
MRLWNQVNCRRLRIDFADRLQPQAAPGSATVCAHLAHIAPDAGRTARSGREESGRTAGNTAWHLRPESMSWALPLRCHRRGLSPDGQAVADIIQRGLVRLEADHTGVEENYVPAVCTNERYGRETGIIEKPRTVHTNPQENTRVVVHSRTLGPRCARTPTKTSICRRCPPPPTESTASISAPEWP